MKLVCKAQDAANFIAAQFKGIWPGLNFWDINRILYLAQGWRLASGRGILFEEDIVAQRSGPLVLDCAPIATSGENVLAERFSSPDYIFLKEICATYIEFDPGIIKEHVDRKDGAWIIAKRIGGEGSLVPKELIELSFKKSLLEHRKWEKSRKEAKISLSEMHGRDAGDNIVIFKPKI